MATAFGFDIGTAAQGAVFALNAPAKSDRTQAFPSWEAELRRGMAYLCLRGGTPKDKPLETIVAAAHPLAEDALDIVAVEERLPLLLSEPHDALVWRRGAHGLKTQLTTSIAYRNMFPALESVLDHISGRQYDEGETIWLARAIGVAVQQHAADLAPFVETPGKDPVASFIDARYAAVRCAVFHAKNSCGRALRPGGLDSRDVVLHQLLAVQKLVEGLLKALFAVRLPSGGLFHSGFGHMLGQLERRAPAHRPNGMPDSRRAAQGRGQPPRRRRREGEIRGRADGNHG